MNRLTTYQRAYLKQLVIECEVQRLTRDETLGFVNSRLKMVLSVEYVDYVRANIRHNVESRLSHLRKHRIVFISEFFKRIDEIETYQKHLWKTMHEHQEDGYLIKSCISELHQLTITLYNLYEMLPAYSGSEVYAPIAEVEDHANRLSTRGWKSKNLNLCQERKLHKLV
jgi:hypothetical protein